MLSGEQSPTEPGGLQEAQCVNALPPQETTAKPNSLIQPLEMALRHCTLFQKTKFSPSNRYKQLIVYSIVEACLSAPITALSKQLALPLWKPLFFCLYKFCPLFPLGTELSFYSNLF